MRYQGYIWTSLSLKACINRYNMRQLAGHGQLASHGQLATDPGSWLDSDLLPSKTGKSVGQSSCLLLVLPESVTPHGVYMFAAVIPRIC